MIKGDPGNRSATDELELIAQLHTSVSPLRSPTQRARALLAFARDHLDGAAMAIGFVGYAESGLGHEGFYYLGNNTIAELPPYSMNLSACPAASPRTLCGPGDDVFRSVTDNYWAVAAINRAFYIEFGNSTDVATGAITFYTRKDTPGRHEIAWTRLFASLMRECLTQCDQPSGAAPDALRLLETMSDGYLVMNRQFQVTYINPAALRIDGRENSAILGKSHWAAWPGSEDLAIGRLYKEVMSSRIGAHIEQAYQHMGEERWFDIAVLPHEDGIALLYADITERKRAALELAHSEMRFRQMANTIPQLAWIADASGSIEWFNDRWYAYTGCTAEEMRGWGWRAVHHPEHIDEVLAAWQTSLATGTPFEKTFPLKGADGSYRSFFTLVSPMRDPSGAILNWFGTNTDVSTYEATQVALRHSEERLHVGLAAGKMTVWEWHVAANTVTTSPNAMELFGHDWSDSERGWQCIDNEYRRRLDAAAAEALEAGTSFQIVVPMRRPDNGRALWVDVRGQARDGQSGTRYFTGVSIDVTERVEAEERLLDANRRKDEFLAMLAHELRNPLSPITSAAHMLTLANVPETLIRKSADVIARQVGYMTNLIDDLLDVSRVTRGLVALDMRMIRLTEVLAGAREQVSPLVVSRGQTLTINGTAEGIDLWGDCTRLIQVFANVLNNASKYTPHGGSITIEIERLAGHVALSVHDTGMGIEPTLLPYVFDLFAQGERTSDRSQGGLGLGLALVKSLVALHGGGVSACSEGAGRGSTFRIVLPQSTTESVVVLQSPTVAGARELPLRITLVDDNVEAVLSLGRVLEAIGHDVSIFHTGEELMVALTQLQFQHVYILDIGLPGMDGYEIARRLRHSSVHGSAGLIALTGYAQSHDVAMGKSVGFDHWLVKPVDMQRLQLALQAIGTANSPAAIGPE